MKEITDLYIATEPFDARLKVETKIDKAKWIEFIDSHADYFTWAENTEKGIEMLSNIDKVPESFREGLIKGYQKSKALAEYNFKKGYYEIIVQINEKFGITYTTFMKPIKEEHIKLLLEMAEHSNALLLNKGKEILTWEDINKRSSTDS